jgi:hypothetical protein
MKNLAGNKFCDTYITEELMLAKINLVRNDQIKFEYSEVPYSVTGEMQGFTFHRAWNYWIINGYMPLLKAQELYYLSKELQIRVNGDCSNPEPTSKNAEPINHSEIVSPFVDQLIKHEINYEDAEKFAFDAEKGLPLFITSYHIDTQEGLNKFVSFIKEFGINGSINGY